MSLAVCLPSPSSTWVIPTVAPSDANSRASSAPCPRAPPVISATLPSSLPIAPTLQEGCRTLDVLVRDLEQDAIEDEELRDPQHAEPDHVADVGEDLRVGVAVLEEH